MMTRQELEQYLEDNRDVPVAIAYYMNGAKAKLSFGVAYQGRTCFSFYDGTSYIHDTFRFIAASYNLRPNCHKILGVFRVPDMKGLFND